VPGERVIFIIHAGSLTLEFVIPYLHGIESSYRKDR